MSYYCAFDGFALLHWHSIIQIVSSSFLDLAAVDEVKRALLVILVCLFSNVIVCDVLLYFWGSHLVSLIFALKYKRRAIGNVK